MLTKTYRSKDGGRYVSGMHRMQQIVLSIFEALRMLGVLLNYNVINLREKNAERLRDDSYSV
jgi:hypothetical protein